MAETLVAERLTGEAFAPFGDVIDTAGARALPINEGTTTRFDDLADIDVGAGGGRPVLSVFRAVSRPLPIRIRMMERHPLGSQAFFPLAVQDWLVVVCRGTDRPDPASLRCFRAAGTQGVNYRAGTWHHPLLVLAPMDFLVVDRGGPGNNLEEVWFDSEADHRMIGDCQPATAGVSNLKNS